MRRFVLERILWIVVILLGGGMLVGCELAPQPVPPPFRATWLACGGAEGAGEWLDGPRWFKGNLIGVAKNMVFVWRVDTPAQGVCPLQINPPQSESALHEAGFEYRFQHNIVPETLQWILSHGGWECSGKPMGEPMADGERICQVFANMKLCYDKVSHQVRPQPLGLRFLEEKGAMLQPKLPTAVLPQPGWKTQVDLSVGKDSREVKVVARVVGGSKDAKAALAIQVGEAGAKRAFYYYIASVSELREGVWQSVLHLPQLPAGRHTIVVEACAVGEKSWLACDEDSVQLQVPSAP